MQCTTYKIVDISSCDALYQPASFTRLLNYIYLVLVKPMIFAGALYFGFLPRIVDLLGWQALSASISAMQSSIWGLLYYGLLVFCMEFVPVGGINPKEVAEYLGLVRRGGNMLNSLFVMLLKLGMSRSSPIKHVPIP